MKDLLIPVGCNELLDFVRRCHSATPQPAPFIVSSTITIALWRVISPAHQRSIRPREVHTSQLASAHEPALRYIQYSHRRMVIKLNLSISFRCLREAREHLR
jgi:hypothetical protein